MCHFYLALVFSRGGVIQSDKDDYVLNRYLLCSQVSFSIQASLYLQLSTHSSNSVVEEVIGDVLKNRHLI